MKMSKSINDYKEAMDNIKISESFYKRTEVLLTEIPEVKIEKRSAVSGRRVSAVIMSAAACVICLFGVKLALDGRQTDIVTETAVDTNGDTGGELITETGREADELIDELTDYDDEIIAESDSFIADGAADGKEQDASTESKPVAVNPMTSTETSAPASTPAETKATTVTTAPQQSETGKSTTASEKRIVKDADPNGSSANATSEKKDTEKPAPMTAAGGIVPEEEDIMDDAEEAEYDEAAPTASAEAEKTMLFSELSLDNITVDVTPYFNMDGIKSGEGTVKKSGAEFKPILDIITNIDSYAVKIGNGSFTSLFSVRIYDENIDLDFYNIYLTNQCSIVITKHSPDGSQVRETYALRKEYYESVKYKLFLMFGSESDYELFTNLIGGK